MRRLCSSPFESLCWFINNRGLDGASVTAAKLAELIIEEGELTVGVEARLHVGVLCPSKAKSRDDFQRKYYYSVEMLASIFSLTNYLLRMMLTMLVLKEH